MQVIPTVYNGDKISILPKCGNQAIVTSLYARFNDTNMQTAVCNRHHTIEQQLLRWVLLTVDRILMGELVMTQELIAYMLCVRRVGIAEAAGKLKALGFIRYCRGHFTVVGRVGLLSVTCECYLVVKKNYIV